MGSIRSEETGVKRINVEIKEQFTFIEDDHYDLGGEEGKHCSKCNKVLPVSFSVGIVEETICVLNVKNVTMN